jgi:quinol-cytochrome oxidoreductase complex cytochrome b subunit
MMETSSKIDTIGEDFSRDQGLVFEIPAGIADLLHERAKERYLRRVWQTLFCVILVLSMALLAPVPALTPGERIAGVGGVLAFLGYLAYGFTLVWPERWEHQLLEEEIQHRRLHGKWRWER